MASSTPATSANVVFGWSFVTCLARALPGRPRPALGLVHDEDERPDDQDHRDQLEEEPDERRPLLRIDRDLDALLGVRDLLDQATYAAR